jgi:hypothetical protein
VTPLLRPPGERRPSEDPGQDVVRQVQPPLLLLARDEEHFVEVAVRPDLVARGRDRADRFGIAFRIVARNEEGRLDACLVEQLEIARNPPAARIAAGAVDPGRIGADSDLEGRTVEVYGQRHNAARAVRPGRPAETPSARHHGLCASNYPRIFRHLIPALAVRAAPAAFLRRAPCITRRFPLP